MDTTRFTKAQRGFQIGAAIGFVLFVLYVLQYTGTQYMYLSMGLIVMLVAAIGWILVVPNLGVFLCVSAGGWIGSVLFLYQGNLLQQISILIIIFVILLGIKQRIHFPCKGGKTQE